MTEPLDKDEFDQFKTNDFEHLRDKCYKMFSKITRMEGAQYVQLAILIAILTWALAS